MNYEGAKSSKHFLDTAVAEKPWAIFVDSTILVNGYHIYSTACNYNSSVSNLCSACWDASQVLAAVANFPPFPWASPAHLQQNMLRNMLGGRRYPSLKDRWPSWRHLFPHRCQPGAGRWENGCQLDTQGINVGLILFHSHIRVWLTAPGLTGGGGQRSDQETDQSLPKTSLEVPKDLFPGPDWGRTSNAFPRGDSPMSATYMVLWECLTAERLYRKVRCHVLQPADKLNM